MVSPCQSREGTLCQERSRSPIIGAQFNEGTVRVSCLFACFGSAGSRVIDSNLLTSCSLVIRTSRSYNYIRETSVGFIMKGHIYVVSFKKYQVFNKIAEQYVICLVCCTIRTRVVSARIRITKRNSFYRGTADNIHHNYEAWERMMSVGGF